MWKGKGHENIKGTLLNSDYDNQKQPENVMYFNCLDSMITNDARCTREIKARITMEKAAFNKKTRFISKLNLNLTEKLAKCYIWSIDLYGAENWTLRKQIIYKLDVYGSAHHNINLIEITNKMRPCSRIYYSYVS
jgi:hypothetical protein